VRTSGQASLDGLNAFFQEVLQDSRWRPGMRALLDDRGLDWSTMRARDLQARIEGIAAERERIGKAQVATVVARTLDYGLQRMMQAFSGGRLDPEFSEGLPGSASASATPSTRPGFRTGRGT